MTAVDRLYNEFSGLAGYLRENSEPSFLITVDEYFTKSLLLCAASNFEHRLTTAVFEYSKEVAGPNTLVPSFVRNKAIARQYHTWFDWNKANANSFFGLFGDQFNAFMRQAIQGDVAMQKSIKDFLELGNERNRLIHQDFGTFSLEKTAEEIYQLYQSASKFVDRLPRLLRECSDVPEVPADAPAQIT